MIKIKTFFDNEEQIETTRALLDTRSTNRKSNTATFEIREQFATYFNKLNISHAFKITIKINIIQSQ